LGCIAKDNPDAPDAGQEGNAKSYASPRGRAALRAGTASSAVLSEK